MKRLRFKKIDAFSSGGSPGNPAGFISLQDEDELSAEEMQRIGRELKGYVSEVGFVCPAQSGRADLRLRFFSCEREVDFCGHATIAIMDDLIRNDPAFGGRQTLVIETKKGSVCVENHVYDDGRVYIHAPDPVFRDTPVDIQEVTAALGLEDCSIDRDLPIGTVNAGLETLLVPIASLDACLQCSPAFETLLGYTVSHSVDIVTIYTPETQYPHHDLHTRVFAPRFGYLEDPATGTGNAALGDLLAREGLWTGGSCIIEQGTDRLNPNIIRLILLEEGGLMFGGNGTVRVDGYYILAQ